MPYCDHHGWGWEPGKGPSSCMGETLSFWLALGVLFSSVRTEQGSVLHTVQYPAGSGAATRVHSAQITLSIAQSIIALAGGMISARPRGMLCGALVLHSLGWTLAWLASAAALQRNPRFARCLLWWWLGGAASNSVVLSSLHNASEHEGYGLPAEISALNWLSFFGSTLLVLLQLTKPELDDTDTVYVRIIGGDRLEAVPTSGWQAFWNGGDTSDVTTRGRGAGRGTSCCYCCSGSLLQWVGRLFCCRWEGGGGGDNVVGSDGVATLGGGGAWPIAREAGAQGSTLNESLLGTIGVGGSVSVQDEVSPSNAKGGWKGHRRASGGSSVGETGSACFQRIGGFLSAIVNRGDRKATAEQQNGNEGLPRYEDTFRRSVRRTTLAVGMGTATRPPRGAREQSLFTSASYAAPSCAPRAPPQAAAPVFGVSVTQWRLVDADGTPSAHGAPADVVWNDRSTERSDIESRSSAHTANLSGSEVPTVSSIAARSDAGPSAIDEEERNYSSMTPLTVQFELAVRASGRGEMDWWGLGGGTETSVSVPTSNFASSSAATAAGDWRVWRSAADMLALYDALALRFGQEFCGRVARPQFNTAVTNGTRAATRHNGGTKTLSPCGGSLPPPTAPHRVDILRDARRAGAFLRSLLGLRQFLSTAVMDFLAQPPHEAQPLSSEGNKGSNDEATHGNEDCQSWDGSDAGSATDESDDEGAPGAGYSDASRRTLVTGKVGTGVNANPSAAGEAMAVAALATDYGTWLKRLAVKLRRSAPAGERFVRLRRIGPAVTGEQVVRWLMTSSGECKGDRASAVRLGQDMVSRGLLSPLCAGYGPPHTNTGASATEVGERRDLLRSFDDAVGWLFAYAGDALRDPFVAPPPTKVVVMMGTRLDVRISDWIETSDDQGAHVSFVLQIQVQATQESWDVPRRYRDFTQLRKRLLRLGVNIPTLAATSESGRSTGAGALSVDLPKKTWRANKFDKDHLATRRAALEAYLQAAVEAALATPHLAGHLVMRFLDPDESNLRVLSGQNPFGPLPPRRRGTEGRRGRGGGGGRGSRGAASEGDGKAGETGHVAQEKSERLREDQAEAEDFDTLTDSLGGFG